MKISNFLIPQDSSDSSPHSNSPGSSSVDLCSFTSSNNSPSTTKKKHLGRKINSDTEILSHFYTFRASSIGQPKKEYLRCKLIRGHKKANRQIEKNIIPIKSFNSYNYHNPQSIALWNKLSEIYKTYSYILKDLSKTENTIIASKKKNKLKVPSFTKSFNACFCSEYFQRLEVRESFYYYIEYLFSDFEPDVLCRKFNFNCCKSKKHSEICYEKWEKVKQYINNEMILELKLEPWFPNCDKILDEPKIEEIEKKSPELYLDFNQPSWIRKIYVQKIELINPNDIFKVNIIKDVKV